jgi:hypothetical protein
MRINFMKNKSYLFLPPLFLMNVVLSTPFAHASGSRCSSTCVYYNPDEMELRLLGRVHNAADMDEDDLYPLLEDECDSRAEAASLPSGYTSLVRSVRFHQQRSVNAGSASSITLAEGASRFFCAEVFNYQHSEWISINQSIDADLQFDDEDRACKPDKKIPSGTTPEYPGNLNAQG